jgi:aspartate kinase
VALAASLGAEFCEIYTDVPGVFTADPRIEATARKLHAVSYEEMLELAASGARVLQTRSVEYARRSGITLHVRSSFGDEDGTWIVEEDPRMEQAMISGVAHDSGEVKVTLQGVPDRPGVAASVFRTIADEGVPVDMIVQLSGRDGRTDISFTAPKAEVARLDPLMDRVVKELGAAGHELDDQVAKVSLVGAGIKSDPGVAAEMFAALAEEGINIEMISTSSIRVSCVVRASDAERAVRAIHIRFRLAERTAAREEH